LKAPTAAGTAHTIVGENSTMTNPDRRQFLKTATAASAVSYGRILGANDRPQIGAIGTGGRCQYLLTILKQTGGNDIVAVCDVYGPRRAEAREKIAPTAKEYVDYREVLDRKDIDAVVIGTPDHWHVPITIDSVRAGKDVYCEKPVTHTPAEGEPLIRAVRESQRVVQTGTQQRSWQHFKLAKEVIDSGTIGQVTYVRTYWYQNHTAGHKNPPAFDTSQLEWKRFLGSAPDQPFDADRFANWRWYWDFGGGAMTDLFVHWVDVAHWFMANDTPAQVSGLGTRAILLERQTPDTMNATLVYPANPNAYVVSFDSALLGYLEGGGLVFRGTKGMMRLHRGAFVVYPEVPRYNEAPEMKDAIVDAKSTRDGTIDHMENFLECMRTRKTPNSSVEIGVAAARAGHLANEAMRGPKTLAVKAS
jgi:predicted dehydrogenase